MSTRKLLLQSIGLAFTIWLLAGCGSTRTEPTTLPTPLPPPTPTATNSAEDPSTIDFIGHWENESFNFSLDLSQDGQHLQGSHVVIAQQGNRIDSLDKSIEGNIQGNTAVVHFQSSYTTNTGVAQITFIDQNTISWKVTQPPDGEYYLPQEATLVKTMPTPLSPPTPAVTIPAKSGTIMGHVHLAAPPTPPMVVYAVDQMTGLWAFTETSATDGPAPFSLAVSPGSYQIYAFMDNGGYTAYSKDGMTLAVVSIAENQTVADIEVGPPGQSECGSMFGVPASPDGRFAAIAGATEECLASLSTPQPEQVEPPAPVESELMRIQFAAGDDSTQVFGSIPPGGINHYVLGAMANQKMTVSIDVFDDNPITLAIAGADGTILNQYDTNITTWTGVLPATQDYYIDILSRDDQATIDYALVVAIPAAAESTTQTTGGNYEPVPPAVCQTLQEVATQALSTIFTVESGTPFVDPLSGETGRGCTLTATGTGVNFSNPVKVTADLVSGFVGWTEQPTYQASGPTGEMTAMTRDMGLMLISAEWVPAPEAQCPSDQPISACDLKPEQKLYTVQIQVAMK